MVDWEHGEYLPHTARDADARNTRATIREDYYQRDSDWIARNLGDVPYRHTGGLWELVAAVGVDGPLPSSAWTPGRIMEGELVRSTDGTMGRLGAGVTLRD